jgi:perosamine synthetase
MQDYRQTKSEPAFFYRGRVALYAILRALGVRQGSTVLLQAFTCTAVPEAILALGAVPRYVDLEPGGINMCPAALDRALETGGDVVVVQHTFGIPAAIEEIVGVCAARDVPLIEDCCHVLGLPIPGGLGSRGVASFFSYEWGKPIPVGIGGAALGNSEDIVKKLRSIADSMASPPFARQIRLEVQYYAYRLMYSPKRYWMLRRLFRNLSRVSIAEGNYHLSGDGDVSSEFGWTISSPVLARVRKAETQITERRERIGRVVQQYREGIHNTALRHLIDKSDGQERVLARYPLMAERKADLLRAAERHNVEIAGWYASPVHPLHGDLLRSVAYHAGSCPNAEAAAERIVSLPIQNAGDRDINRIVSFLNKNW